MTGPKELNRLADLTDMVLQLCLADLRNAAARREECEASLAAISVVSSAPGGLEGIASQQALLAYQKWVDNRREELNRQLARKTADWLEARDAATAAFGKCRALSLLSRNLSKG